MTFSRRRIVTAMLLSPIFKAAEGLAAPDVATPEEGDSGSASARLAALLQYLPVVPGRNLDLSWSDFARQRSAVPGDDFASFLSLLPFAFTQDDLYAFALQQEIEQTLGFSLERVQQSVLSGRLPDVVRVYELDTPVAPFAPAWEAAGYERRENQFGTFWTVGEEGELSLTDPFQRMALAKCNNIAILDENVCAFAPTSKLLSLVMNAAAEKSKNLVDSLSPLAEGLPADAVSALFRNGDVLTGSDPASVILGNTPEAESSMAASNDAVGPMPEIRAIVAGVTAGASQQIEHQLEMASAFMVIQTKNDGEAEHVNKVAEWRINNLTSQMDGRPYSEILGPVTYETVQGDLARLSAGGSAAQSSIFVQMIMRFHVVPFQF